MGNAFRDQLYNLARMMDNGQGRTLPELIKSHDMLKGAESQRLRSFCTQEYMDPDRDLDAYGEALMTGDLMMIEQDFDERIQKYSESYDFASKKVCEELFQLRWGPTRVPIFNLLGLFRIIRPDQKHIYLDIARFLIGKGVPVDGTDLSGTTALSHSFSTKPGFDLEYAQILFDAGGDVNHRNRYGATVAHEIVQVYTVSQTDSIQMAVESLTWFLSHGGGIDIADSDGMVPRFVCERLQKNIPQLLHAVKKEDRRRKLLEGTCCSLCAMQPSTPLKICGGCMKAKYCGPPKQCNKLDWPRHKAMCQRIKGSNS